MELLVGFGILIVLIVIGVPILAAFGAATIWLTVSLGYTPDFLMPTGYNKMTGVVLLAIPLFIILGGIMEKGAIGEALVRFVENFVGRVRGALNIVSTVACAVFGAICGSGAATLSCIGSIMAPKMRERGYPMGLAGAVLACSAPIGMLIPPSSIQILFAWAGQLSVLACFLSTVLPGLMLTALISVVGWFLARNNKDIVISAPLTAKQWRAQTRQSTVYAVPALLMPILVLGGIYGGFMTPSEAAAVAVVYAIPVSIMIYKGMRWRDLWETIIDTANTTGVIMVMLAIIMIMSRILVMEDLPDVILGVLLKVSENPLIILLMINLFLVLIGMIMDDVSGTLLTAPILIPIAANIGVSPYHMAAILGVNLGMGNATPPTAPFLYLGARICGTEARAMLKPMFIIILFAYVPTLIATTYIPGMALWLPEKLLGIS